ncbi:MAG TPA: excinuclease ABC subunit C, partial [Edaphobacter sp.]
LMLAAVPLSSADATTEKASETAHSPEDRARTALAELDEQVQQSNDLATLSDHLSLFRRWYYRPEKQRVGEAFLPNPDGGWPVRRILNGAARQVLGDPKPVADVQRDAAKKTRVLHKGRPDVEREVPVVESQE